MNTGLKKIVRSAAVTGVAVAVIAAAGIYSGWNPRAQEDAPAQAQAAPRAVPVTVQTLAPQKVRVWSEFSGRLHAVEAAEIRPQVGGRITAVQFDDGQVVKAGDVLFIIDPRPYEAAVSRARANLASARTNAGFAKVELERASGMIKTQAIAQRVYDERANASRVAEAAQDAADAELKQAALDLEHAHVRAPIAGRVSRAEITVGNLVQPGPGAPLLTTIVANQAVYAEFDVDEQTYVQSIRGQASAREAERRIPVRLALQSDQGRVYEGTIHSFDNRIDVATGTIRARAKFDNADGALLPGMFVAVRLADAGERDALLIPDRAIGFDQSKKFVYVVDGENKVAYRQVELGKQIQSQRIALKGVAPGDRVIVDGVQHVRPNTLVAATEAAASRFAQATPVPVATAR